MKSILLSQYSKETLHAFNLLLSKTVAICHNYCWIVWSHEACTTCFLLSECHTPLFMLLVTSFCHACEVWPFRYFTTCIVKIVEARYEGVDCWLSSIFKSWQVYSQTFQPVRSIFTSHYARNCAWLCLMPDCDLEVSCETECHWGKVATCWKSCKNLCMSYIQVFEWHRKLTDVNNRSNH